MKESKTDITNSFLWNLAGFNKTLIKDSKADRFHASIIGVLLLLVGIYAVMAWTFFFQTVSDNLLISIIGGLFMGFFIVSLDRALIASLSSDKTKLFSLIFRFILALLLGVFLSQPMILKFYQHEIKKEATIIYTEKVKEQKAKLNELYQNDLKNLADRKSELQNQLIKKENKLTFAENDFKQEMDGTGGSQKRGYSIISKQKEKIYKQRKNDLEKLKYKYTIELDSIQNKINVINSNVTIQNEKFKANNSSFGTLIQVEALHSILNNDKTGSLKLRYYLLSLILILIELSALIAKLLFKTESYKSKVQLTKELELVEFTNTKKIALANLKTEIELITKSNKESMGDFFTNAKTIKKHKANELLSEWKTDDKASFKGFWNRFKSSFILR